LSPSGGKKHIYAKYAIVKRATPGCVNTTAADNKVATTTELARLIRYGMRRTKSNAIACGINHTDHLTTIGVENSNSVANLLY